MQFEAILRGVNFRPASAKEVVTNLEEGAKLTLERAAGNPHDENAIKVIEPESGEFIGYVAKEIAADLAPLLDDGVSFSCAVQGFMRVGMPILEIVSTEPIEDEEEAD